MAWWCYESKHVATLVDNKLVVFWLNLLLEYLSENASGWLQLKQMYSPLSHNPFDTMYTLFITEFLLETT